MLEDLCCCCFDPVRACTVVFVDNGGWGDVNHVKISGSVSERNGIFDAFICGHNFWFSGAYCGAAFLERFTGEGDSTSGGDMDRHWAKLASQKFSAVRYRVADLTSPAGVRVWGRIVGFVRYGRGGIHIGLRGVVRWDVDKGFSEGGCVRVVWETKRGGVDKVFEGVQGHFVVIVIQCSLVRNKEV